MSSTVIEAHAPQSRTVRHSLWVRITHWLIALSVFGLLFSGIGILVSHPRLYWGETGALGTESLIDLPIQLILGPSVWNRPYHFFFAWMMVLASLAYFVGSLTTNHFRRDLLPDKDDIRLRKITGVIWSHLRGLRTDSDDAWTYNVVQRLTYLGVMFILLPAIVLTGLGMSFGVTSAVPILATSVGGHQSARTLHFVFSSLLVVFLIVHLAMLFVVGFVSHVRAMISGRVSPQAPVTANKLMAKNLTRRNLVTASLATVAGVSGIGAASHFGNRFNLIPPARGSLLDVSETLTYATQRVLTSHQPLAREFDRSEISKISPVNGPAPVDDTYRSLAANGFRDWRLMVEGSVARPRSFSLSELKAFPVESRIILHACEEGWSYIAEWTGVRLSTVLEAAEIRSEAKYVNFIPFANPNNAGRTRLSAGGSIDMADALHPQTLLAYAMNGEELLLDHGAPIRLRLSRQLGYKNTKYLLRIVVTDNSDFYSAGANTWYGGI